MRCSRRQELQRRALLKIETSPALTIRDAQGLPFWKEAIISIFILPWLTDRQDLLEKLADADLDEIRLHPPQECWKDLKNSPYARYPEKCKELGIEAGSEIPALEGAEKVGGSFCRRNDVFLNLNELEFSDNNSELS